MYQVIVLSICCNASHAIYEIKFSFVYTVEPLMNDHPHLRPPAFYDRFFIDGMSTLYKRSLTNDHPADVTNDHGNLNFTPDKRPSDRWPAHLLT